MTREWKPGDVITNGSGRRWFVLEGGEKAQAEWNGSYPVTAIVNRRPLVVIDPDDREQIERLNASIQHGDSRSLIDNLQAALREFADPPSPRPDEPLLLGAVVEDNECEVWVRADVGSFAWRRTGMSGDEYKSYAQINAVRVLSPGYDPEATT